MARNFNKEYEWSKNKYERILANIDKELGIALRAKLKAENKTIASWMTDNIKKYLEK